MAGLHIPRHVTASSSSVDPGSNRGPTCGLCGLHPSEADLVPLAAIRPSIAALVQHDRPEIDPGALICRSDLVRYTRRHIQDLLADEQGQLAPLDLQVLDSIVSGDPLAQGAADLEEAPARFGERMADRLSALGGSWGFLIGFAVVVTIWMGVNAVGVMRRPFDPYPFILLNLVLSCLAAIQAPVIMMSQRRLEAKDRRRAESDYRINLKAELEIRALNEKLDHIRDQLVSLRPEVREPGVGILPVEGADHGHVDLCQRDPDPNP